MDRNFTRSLALVLKSEGGWSDNPDDPGGATMKGITLATYRAYIKPGGSKVDLRAITDDQLSTCYRKEYWDAVSGDQLPDGVDYAVMDFGVNSGPSRAARYLQSVVGAPMDGNIGPATLAAIATMPAGVIIDHLCDARLAFLKSLKTWNAFGKGWTARVESVRTAALMMTAEASAPSAAAPQTSPGPVLFPDKPGVTVIVQQGDKPPVITQTPARPAGKHVGIAVGVLGLGAALASWWHEIATWVHSFF